MRQALVLAATALVFAACGGSGGAGDGEPTTPAPESRCPAGWQPYDDADGRFSICIPPDFNYFPSPGGLYIASPEATATGGDSTADITLGISIDAQPAFGDEAVPDEEVCSRPVVANQESGRVVSVSLADTTVPACLNTGRTTGGEAEVPVGQLRAALPLADGTYLNFQVVYRAGDPSRLPRVAEELLGTFAVR